MRQKPSAVCAVVISCAIFSPAEISLIVAREQIAPRSRSGDAGAVLSSARRARVPAVNITGLML